MDSVVVWILPRSLQQSRRAVKALRVVAVVALEPRLVPARLVVCCGLSCAAQQLELAELRVVGGKVVSMRMVLQAVCATGLEPQQGATAVLNGHALEERTASTDHGLSKPPWRVERL